MVEYAHAFREGTYRRRTALAASARRRGCVPLPRSASRGLACNGIRCAAGFAPRVRRRRDDQRNRRGRCCRPSCGRLTKLYDFQANGRQPCVPRLRTARFRMPRTVCLAAHGGSAGRRSLPCRFLLFLSIPLAHGFARGASSALCRRALRSGKVMCATARALPDAMFHVKQFIALQCDKGTNVSRETSGRGTRSKTGLAFLGKSARRRAARMNR